MNKILYYINPFVFFKYKTLNDYLYSIELNSINSSNRSTSERDLAIIDLDYKYNKISIEEYDKKLYNIQIQYKIYSEIEAEKRLRTRELKRKYFSTEKLNEEIEKMENDINYKFNILSIEEHRKAEIEILYKYHPELYDNKLKKEYHTLMKKPWMNYNISLDENAKDENKNIIVTLDYNEYLISDLRAKGYTGTEDEIINSLVKNFAIEMKHAIENDL